MGRLLAWLSSVSEFSLPNRCLLWIDFSTGLLAHLLAVR